MNALRKLIAGSTAILACAGASALFDTAAAQAQSQGQPPRPVRSAEPAAKTASYSATTRSTTKRWRRHSHSACEASRRRREGRVTCHAAKAHPSESHAARNSESHAARNHSGRRGRTGHRSAKTSSSSESSQSLASVLATPCQNTELIPEEGNLEEIDAATLCLVNQERARNGELPLRTNGALEEAAQAHSEEMVSQDYFAHIAPSGLTPVGRVEGTGYIPNPQVGYALGENIAWGTLQLSTPSAIVAAWIASPEHLANILYGSYRDTAIGVAPEAPASLAQGQPGALYTQEFGVIIP
jgi:uncharacterized protein YkwD